MKSMIKIVYFVVVVHLFTQNKFSTFSSSFSVKIKSLSFENFSTQIEIMFIYVVDGHFCDTECDSQRKKEKQNNMKACFYSF